MITAVFTTMFVPFDLVQGDEWWSSGASDVMTVTGGAELAALCSIAGFHSWSPIWDGDFRYLSHWCSACGDVVESGWRQEG